MTAFFNSHHCILQKHSTPNVLTIPHIDNTENFTGANALHHHEFLALLVDTESKHGERIYHINMRWLSHGSVLKSFYIS